MTLVQQKAAFLLLSALLIVSLGIAAVPLVRHVTGSVGHQVQLSPDTPPTPASPHRVDLTPILAWAPFGAASPPPEATPQATTLSLALLGVLIANPPSLSTAIIVATDGVPHPYQVGDDITGGAKLKAVFADSVTLDVSGQEETLAFTTETAPQSSGVAAIRATIPASAGGGLDQKPGDVSAPADAVIDDYRNRIAADPQTVLKDVGVAATGKGYKLTASMIPELRRAGFQPDDLVVRVNGNEVGDVDRDKKLFDQVVASGRMRMEVMRNGNLIVISLPFR